MASSGKRLGQGSKHSQHMDSSRSHGWWSHLQSDKWDKLGQITHAVGIMRNVWVKYLSRLSTGGSLLYEESSASKELAKTTGADSYSSFHPQPLGPLD
ncbi:hypothetical protein FCV25MIE_13191 [Fagus crenata]